jgi:hypothetical protein
VDAHLAELERRLEMELAHVRAARAALRKGPELRPFAESPELRPASRIGHVRSIIRSILELQQRPMTATEIHAAAAITAAWEGSASTLHTVISRMVARNELKAWGLTRSRRYGLPDWPASRITAVETGSVGGHDEEDEPAAR